MEDGASCHWSKKTNEAWEKLHILNLDHPPQSPDLNCIENVWLQLTMWVSRLPRKATTLEELWEQVQEVWKGIDHCFINDLIDYMPERVSEIQKSGGKITRFGRMYLMRKYASFPPYHSQNPHINGC
jgi:hypothetical protein